MSQYKKFFNYLYEVPPADAKKASKADEMSIDRNLEEGFMDTLGKVRDTTKGVRHAARFVRSAAKGGDAKSALKLVGQSVKHAYDQGGVANVGNMLRKIGRTDHVQDLLGKMRSVRAGGPGKGSAGSFKIKQAEKDARTGELRKGAEAGIDTDTGSNMFYNPLKEKMATKPKETPAQSPKSSDLKTPRRPKEPDVLYKTESLNENTVSRFQQLAGIKPTE